MTDAIAITGIGRVSDRKNCGKLTAKRVLGYAYKPFGRLDHFSKLGLAGIFKAMKDARRHEWKQKRNIGLVASTIFGCLETDRDYFATVIPDHGIAASPALFAYTLPNCFLGEAAILLGLTGECLVINDDDSTGIKGLAMAMATLIQDPSVEAMVCGICDTQCPEQIDRPDCFYEGAIFMLLENAGQCPFSHYGTLDFDGSGNIVYNQKTVSDIDRLTDDVLKGKKS